MYQIFFHLMVAVVFGFWAGSKAQAQTMIEETLIEVYRSNPSILAQRDALQAQDEAMPQALSGWLPSAEFNSSVGRRRTERSQSLSVFGNTEEITAPRTARITINQPVYQGGGTVAATRRAKSTILAARADLTAVEQDTLLEAATIFLNVVRDQALLDLSRRQKAVLERQMQATSDQFDVGEATRADLYQARARHARALADVVRAEGVLEITQAAYLSHVGVAARVLKKPEKIGLLPSSLTEALNTADQKNPRITAALHTEEASRFQIDETHSRLLPDVNIRAQADYNTDTQRRGGKSHSLEVIADLRLPIYQSGQAMSQIRQSKYRYRQSRQNVERIRRDVAAQVKTAWQGLTTARARILALSEEIEANAIALDGVRQEASVGTRTVLDILDAEQALYDSRTSLVQAERDELVASFELQATVGRFTASALDLDTEIYNPNIHYQDVKYKFWGTDIDNKN